MSIDMGTAGEVTKREDAGIDVVLHDANGEPTDPPVTVRIAGSYSARYRKVQDAQTQRMIKRRQKSLTPEELSANRSELVAACILGWDGFTHGDKPFPFTRENADLVAKTPWIRDQLEDAQQDHASFGKGSSTS